MSRPFVRVTTRCLHTMMLALALGCSDSLATQAVPSSDMCSIPASDIINGGPGKDGIPALTDPTLVSADDPGAAYMNQQDERVIGLVTSTGPVAIPLPIMWWHEIVNLDVDGVPIAVTHCPLTGSSMAFDRTSVGGAEFGVSGLLFKNNLIMYDRSDEESLWPQMSRGARCGTRDGSALNMIPVVEMTWEGWKGLHPDTRVVSSDTGHDRDYTRYPYGFYDDPDNGQLLFPMTVDGRRPPKERVLGVPRLRGITDGDHGLAYPFGELAEAGPVAAIEHTMQVSGDRAVVFWDAASEAAMLYLRRVGTTELTFAVDGDRIIDVETGSEWSVDGQAVSGPHAGQRLEPFAEAYVAYWFAWATFEADTELWTAP